MEQYHNKSLIYSIKSVVKENFASTKTCFLTIGNDPGYTIGVKQIMIDIMSLILTVEMTMECVRQLAKQLFYD